MSVNTKTVHELRDNLGGLNRNLDFFSALRLHVDGKIVTLTETDDSDCEIDHYGITLRFVRTMGVASFYKTDEQLESFVNGCLTMVATWIMGYIDTYRKDYRCVFIEDYAYDRDAIVICTKEYFESLDNVVDDITHSFVLKICRKMRLEDSLKEDYRPAGAETLECIDVVRLAAEHIKANRDIDSAEATEDQIINEHYNELDMRYGIESAGQLVHAYLKGGQDAANDMLAGLKRLA